MSFSLFATLSTSLKGHSYAMDSLAANTANVNTPGAKEQKTHFETLVQSNNRTVNAHDGNEIGISHHQRFNIAQQGTITQSQSVLDLAINGDGFFLIEDSTRETESLALTRSGQFKTTVVTDADGSEDLFITDQQGNPLLGWQADQNGAITQSGNVRTLEPLSVHPDRIRHPASPTTLIEPISHLPYRRGDIGDVYSVSLPLVDDQGQERAVRLDFTQTADPDRWQAQFTLPNADVNVEPFEVAFDPENGLQLNPAIFDLEVAWRQTEEQDAGTASFRVDLSNVKSTGEDFITLDVARDGHVAGFLQDYRIDSEGFVVGEFSNGRQVTVAQIPLVDVVNRDGLQAIDATKWALTEETGDLEIYALNDSDRASIVDFGLEASTVDLQTNFTDLITTQHAYSSLSSVLTAYNEMSQLAVSMKR